MTKPGSKDENDFVKRFERIDDEVPVTDDETKIILADAGLDPSESLKRLFSKLDAAAAQQRRERFVRAEAARALELRRLEIAKTPKSRSELLAQLSLLRSEHPTVATQFRNFESMSDDELHSLLLEIKELVRRAEE